MVWYGRTEKTESAKIETKRRKVKGDQAYIYRERAPRESIHNICIERERQTDRQIDRLVSSSLEREKDRRRKERKREERDQKSIKGEKSTRRSKRNKSTRRKRKWDRERVSSESVKRH